jgi:CD109 antigen
LTAFTAFAFNIASEYITIDQGILNSAFKFIVKQQKSDTGAFREGGTIINKKMQGGTETDLAMTAFISIVLSQSLDKYPEFTTQRNNALNYIANSVNLSNIYDVCIATLALQLGNHESFPTLYAQMISLGSESDDEMSWTEPTPPQTSSDTWWNSEPSSVNIEMTAYALRVLSNSDISKAQKAAKWLVSKKYPNFGYSSTQETVQVLNALSVFNMVLNVQSRNIKVELKPNVGRVFNAQVTQNNSLTVQEFDLDSMARQLEVLTDKNSTGNAIVTMVCNFNLLSNDADPRFNITSKLLRPCLPLVREVCISFTARGNDVKSNMAVVKITFPSGFIYASNQTAPGGSRVGF